MGVKCLKEGLANSVTIIKQLYNTFKTNLLEYKHMLNSIMRKL